MEIRDLEEKARRVRLSVLESIVASGKGHIGGTYSCTDLLVALYYAGILRFNFRDPRWPDRDRFLIGKGHACLALYSIFTDLGLLPDARFDTYGQDGGLGGQLDTSIPGVEYNTGSYGHVLGIAAGIALAAKMDQKSLRAYALMGDAEMYEGSVWEAIVFAGHHKLDRLVGIIDRNRLSTTDMLDDDSFFKDFKEKMRSFDWDCHEFNGHSFPEILDVFDRIRNALRPVMLIAHTVKGKGISFMENGIKWHHGVPTATEAERARRELVGKDQVAHVR
ncbi:MAG: transketolase [Candidatus Omnitrophica bacterium]|nr:transketolase [Candidatus Omnitrophota bacterium]